ncbi:elongator complex protein 2 [Kwoniella mangroviensis CBS 10435]|uniref:Elongator complex protein 2 n=1 Tax=Kwoniella mangroviensis CBS 10435 TaxID=1331196 RepID=A0A1B9IKE9_9TREE|nr:elongator complex protein 2 [Kwoniella mangroviensis CBS 10435]
MRAGPAYISIGSNRSSSCSASTSNGLLAFGAGKLLALWDTESTSNHGIQKTLPGHKGQITTVKLISSSSGENRFISGDTNGEVRIWSTTEKEGGEWKCEKNWIAHENSSISAIGVSPDGWIITGGSDSKIKIFDGDHKEKQVIKLEKGRLPLDLELSYLPGSKAPILAVGATDRLIRIYTLSPNNDFILSLTLEGHEDWIRCLSFTPYPSLDQTKEDLFLASGSQDNFIRLWRVSTIPEQQAIQEEKKENGKGEEEGLDLLDEFERRLNGEGSGQISTKAHILAVQDGDRSLRYNITLEALLVGHESGLTNVHWSPPSSHSSPLLLSTASDNSLIIWVPSTDGIWVPEHRFGAIGGRGLSFYGAIWGKDGKSVLASGWNGGWERWVKTALSEDEEGGWEVKSGINGHHGDVQSLSWDPREEYLISVGSDQTSRIHASTSIASSSQSQWAEIARPQIHGYDMTDIAFISPLRFISSADEKVARVFDAPEGFVESLRTLGVSEGSKDQEGLRPKGATVPPLGLSNRALQKAPAQTDKIEKEGMNEAIISISHTLTSLPTEEELATSTLWPEIEKIYGHGYELVCVASSSFSTPSGSELIATSSKSTNLEHSGIRIYQTSNWELYGQILKGHSLTVTRIQFSNDNSLILSCSRDRSWRLFRHDKEKKTYEPFVEQEKAHARMILDCCFVKGQNDNTVFATASRDKTVKIWLSKKEDKSEWKCTETIKFTEATTSVDMIIQPNSNGYLLAVGSETGSVSIYALEQVESEIRSKELIVFDESISHVGPVNRLAWRNKDGRLQLASCSDDRSVRVFDIAL